MPRNHGLKSDRLSEKEKEEDDELYRNFANSLADLIERGDISPAVQECCSEFVSNIEGALKPEQLKKMQILKIRVLLPVMLKLLEVDAVS